MPGHEGNPPHIEPQTTDAVPGDPVYSGGAFYIPLEGQVSSLGETVDKPASKEKVLDKEVKMV